MVDKFLHSWQIFWETKRTAAGRSFWLFRLYFHYSGLE